MRNITLFITTLLSFCCLQQITAEDKLVPLSLFTVDGDTYLADDIEEVKAKNKTVYVEMPNATTSGVIGFKGSSNKNDRFLYIHGEAGTQKDESRKQAMATNGMDNNQISYTSSDIMIYDNKPYLVFSTADDFKFKGVKYTATGGGEPVLSNDATLKDLRVNGDTVEGFAADKLSYSVVLEAGTTVVPTVTAVPNSNKAEVEIIDADQLPGTTTIVVAAENQEDTLKYTIDFAVDDGWPIVTDIEFDNKIGEAVIDQETVEITAEIKRGCPRNAIYVHFIGRNLVTIEPNDSVDFSDDQPHIYRFINGSNIIGYFVTITEAEEVLPTGIQLDQTTLTLDEGETAILVATVLPEDADNKTVTWSTSDSTVATVENGTVTAIIAGTATITAKDAEGHKATCTVTVKGEEPLPETGLTTHTPDIYDEPDGYNTPLQPFEGRDYEVFYTQKGKISGTSYAVVITKEGGNYITNSDQKAIDGWFETDAASFDDSGRTVQDEFKVSGGAWKMKDNKSLTMHFKGFDCFRLYAKDAKADQSDRQFHVYIDDFDKEVPMEHSTSATIREFPITTGEHVIKIVAEGSSNMYLYGWSLRVTNDPLVRYISGNTDQTAFQTKSIEPVTYRVRRTENYRLTWANDKAIPGVQPVAGGGDTVRIAGIADAEADTYTYILEALDENGNVASSESGTITIETKIFDSRNNDRETNIAEPIKPIDFVYYGLHTEDLFLSTDITGLELSFRDDSICSLVGSPDAATKQGAHPYTISIAGGNSVSGTITINVPNPYFEQTEAKIRDEKESSFTIMAHHAAEVTIEGLPEGLEGKYDRNTDQITVSGKTQVGAPYPHIYTLTLTATPRYEGKDTVTVEGVLTIIAPDAKAVLLIHKDLESDRKDAVAACLYDLQYDLTLCQQDAIKNTSLDAIDLIVISQNADANHKAILDLIRSDKKPMLNLNGFTYSSDRLGWGEPYNGTVNEDHKASLFVQREDHPIFKDWKPQGKEVNLFETVPSKGIMPIKVDGTVTECMGSLCIATAYTRSITDYFEDGELQTEIHEIPLPKRLNKYICFPIASDVTLSDDGKKIIERTAKYLLSEEPCIQRPGLQIMSFSLAGYAALPQEGEPGSIIIDMTKEEFRALDSLRSATPEITLMDPDHTFLTPTKPMDFRFANLVPVIYTVTDYINIHTYEVTIDVPYEQGIDEVYTSGEWVMIYDIYGRSVATTNEDIYSMTLPRGIYIVITENGNTIKLFK